MKRVLSCFLAMLFAAISMAQVTTSTAKKKISPTRTVEAELQELKDDRAQDRREIEVLQQEVQLLKEEMQKRGEG
jgi:cell division protein FtsB